MHIRSRQIAKSFPAEKDLQQLHPLFPFFPRPFLNCSSHQINGPILIFILLLIIISLVFDCEPLTPVLLHLSNCSFMDTLQKSLKLLSTLLIIKIIAAVLLSYRDYMPPNFDRGFLIDRDPYFFGSYQRAFYVHVTSGPLSLILGLILLSKIARLRFPKWHHILGCVQAANVLLWVAPSGLWMSRYAESGLVAGLGFGTLSTVTGLSVALGWRAAVQRRFQAHQIGMERCFALLCSAVVLRFIGGAATLANIEWPWIYPVSAWISWLLPLSGYELWRVAQRNGLRNPSR